jgi:CelD/BcsL family acetyltransferase involved in cellulose biosynthesis
MARRARRAYRRSVPRFHVDVVRDASGLPALAPAWRALLDETPEATAFHTDAWASAFAGRANASPFVLVVRDGDAPVAILPTALDARGRLHLLGDALDGVRGPVYRPACVADAVAAAAGHLAAGRAVRLVDLCGLRADSAFTRAVCARGVAGWHDARVVRATRCPYVDLAGGWAAVLGRRSRSSREQLGRKWKALGRLGRTEFVELTDAAEVARAMPAVFQLFAERWRGRHESGGFAGANRALHEALAARLAAAGHVRLSLLRLDGDAIAFAYGVRARHVTVSWVVGHATALDVYSPGLLLLTRVLEAACGRGDREYDFGIGDEGYKALWATGSRDVVRVLRAPRGAAGARARSAMRAAGTRLWVAARDVPWLRSLRREGFRRTLFRRAAAPPAARRPPAWRREQAEPRAAGATVARAWTFREMSDGLARPALLAAVDRAYRGDATLGVYRDGRFLGVVWRATGPRVRVVDPDADGGGVVYYDPRPAPGVTATDLADALATAASEPVVILRPAG